MAINHTRDLADIEGTQLEGWYKGKRYRARVVRNRQGELHVRFGSKNYSSLSTAGEAVMGGIACNGWRFWSLDRRPTLRSPRCLRSRSSVGPAARSRPNPPVRLAHQSHHAARDGARAALGVLGYRPGRVGALTGLSVRLEGSREVLREEVDEHLLGPAHPILQPPHAAR